MTWDRPLEGHVGPLREALADVLEKCDGVTDRLGQTPAATSMAMRELAEESPFAGGKEWGSTPVESAFNAAELLIFGAIDLAKSTLDLLGPEVRTPVFAHTVIARACLEHAGRAWWLLEPAIGVKRRVARGINDRIYSLNQQSRLPIDNPDVTKASDRREALFDQGNALGFHKVHNKVTGPMLEENRPGNTKLISKLLSTRHEEDLGGIDPSLGGVVYGLFSAVAHGTAFGLAQSITVDAPNLPKDVPGRTWAAVYTGSEAVVIVLSALLMGLAEAVKRRNTLFGWEAKELNLSFLRALDVANKALPRR
ncbi:MAG: hypothetical protein WD556_13620 [Actinomycetota bacterium]